LILAILSVLSCGKKGPIYPPLVRNPKPIEVFQLHQRGDEIILNWDNPSVYTDGSPLKEIGLVEIWLHIEEREADKNAGTAESGAEASAESEPAPEEDPFPEKAQCIASIAGESLSEHKKSEVDTTLPGEFIYYHELSNDDLTDRTFIFGLKAYDAKKKGSELSALLSVDPEALPLPPSGLRADVSENKIEVAWSAPEKNIDGSAPADLKGYMVYRKSEDEGLRRLSQELVRDTNFIDKDFRFDDVYTYYVRAAAAENPHLLESEDSVPCEVAPKDTFPPKPPRGLVGIAGAGYISLSWNANREPDLAGYRVWRKTEKEKKYTPLTDIIRESIYNDTGIEKNKRYNYAVSALDKSGNESKISKGISIDSGRGVS